MLFVMTKKIHNSPHIAGVLLSTEPDLQLPGQMGPSEARFYLKEFHVPTGHSVLPRDFVEAMGTTVV